MTFVIEPLSTERLVLEPLRVDHAAAMAPVLGDRELYHFTGGRPPTAVELDQRYRIQVVGPPDKTETWFNWILRLADGDKTGPAVGFVQATVVEDLAVVAWLVGLDHQGRGFAVEAAQGMVRWLVGQGVRRLQAHIHPDHVASQRVAAAIDLSRTGEIDDDGEEIWRRPIA